VNPTNDATTAAVPLSEADAAAEARRIIDAAYQPAPTSYRDTSPVPPIGDTPPVLQPGRAPMSQRAADISGIMAAGGIASLPVGAATSLVLWTLGQVDPVNLAIGGAAPVALVLALGAVVRRLQGVRTHTEHHHHYTGPVTQHTTTVNQDTRGVFAKTRNQTRR
jgi:hypothetical protein